LLHARPPCGGAHVRAEEWDAGPVRVSGSCTAGPAASVSTPAMFNWEPAVITVVVVFARGRRRPRGLRQANDVLILLQR
jgi:hypothetical protein